MGGRTLALVPLNEDTLPRPTKLRCPADDSGVCSRMSETSSHKSHAPPEPAELKKAVAAEAGHHHSNDSSDFELDVQLDKSGAYLSLWYALVSQQQTPRLDPHRTKYSALG
jgi:hypothetical protein